MGIMEDFRVLVNSLLSVIEQKSGSKESKNAAVLKYQRAIAGFLKALADNEDNTFDGGIINDFFQNGISAISEEIGGLKPKNSFLSENLKIIAHSMRTDPDANMETMATRHRAFFHPEALFPLDKRDECIRDLRRVRTVSISELNNDPVSCPHRQILFTSNVLLTLPPDIGSACIDKDLKERCRGIEFGDQLYWYDHPVIIGTEPDKNEIVYGLRALWEAVAYEKKKGNMPADGSIDVVLSVSVTHKGICPIAREYIHRELEKAGLCDNLRVFVFTEEDTSRFLSGIILPLAKDLFPETDSSGLCRIFGVDGEYGRHYSFLKAVAVLWKFFMNPELKGTFKIDLDQVFDQKRLQRDTGLTAFEHFRTPLWGAKGKDSSGNNVELGMIAGALVNEKDAQNSLFTPDVLYDSESTDADELVFCSKKPQALSTEAEMMTRYAEGDSPDGISECIQRIHVTGGTNGILVSSLLKFRPFTLSFIGRAEDQAYLMSVLFREEQGRMLRYVHKDGLIMRHDKEAFAGEAIEAAKIGKLVGDYVRILLFSSYARVLPWDFDRIKSELGPFTGSFISSIPLTLVYMRVCLKAAELLSGEKTETEGIHFLEMSAARLTPLVKKIFEDPCFLRTDYDLEKKAWGLFYDVCEKMSDEGYMAQQEEIASRAVKLLQGCCAFS